MDLVRIDNFEWKNWDIVELNLKGVFFPKKDAFKSFTDFVKTLNKIEKLKLDVEDDEQQNQKKLYRNVVASLEFAQLESLGAELHE